MNPQLLLFSFLAVFGIRMWEEPHYEVVRKDGRKEIRRYAPYAVARTSCEGTTWECQRRMFQTLADYIFGNNSATQKLRMTVPVVQQTERGTKLAMTAPVVVTRVASKWEMTFVLPSEFSPATAPRPNNSAVTLVEIPSETLAAIRYTGLNSEQAFQQCAAELDRWVREKTSYRPSGNSRYAGYDPPFAIPFLRRQEALIPVS